jgi:uracil-DNA glycosylase
VSADLYQEALDAAAELVRRAARGKRRTIAVSAEVAALLDTIGPAPGSASGEQREALDALAAEVAACTRCGLSETRTQTVFGAGNPAARLVFVGEAPGEQEDLKGIPFVGAAGQLLTDIIEKGMRMTRDEVFICNVLKCRPPGNRDPLKEEAAACEDYLKRQLALIKPKVIVALGGHAAKTLLRTDESTGRLRGSWHFYEDIPLRVTYHPSYVIRQKNDPEAFATEKRKVWEDMKAVLRLLTGKEDPRA